MPLSYPFMQRALIVSVLVAAVCAVLSCYLVLKGWSLMGDAISHAVLPGIVVAHVLGLPLALGAFVAGLSCALFTGYLKENSRIKEDTVMGIVFSGMFGLGLVIFTKVDTDQHLLHILFGNVLGVTVQDLIETAIVAGGTLAIVLLKRRDLLLYCFDPNHARSIGLPVRVLHYGLLILLSLTIVASLKAVGIILVIAMLIAPGATAYMLTSSFERMLAIATAVATSSAALGTIISFHIDGATGACIVLVQAFAFVLAFLFAPKHGLVWKGRRGSERGGVIMLDVEGCVDRTGWLGGGQIGYNWQAGQVVFGVEFSGSFADLGGGVNAGVLPGGEFFESDGKSLLMLTGRLGWAADRALFYVTGGAASVRANVDLHTPLGGGVILSREVSFTRTGWTFGIGAEYAFTPNWSFAAQYNWIDLGDRDVNFVAFPEAVACGWRRGPKLPRVYAPDELSLRRVWCTGRCAILSLLPERLG